MLLVAVCMPSAKSTLGAPGRLQSGQSAIAMCHSWLGLKVKTGAAVVVDVHVGSARGRRHVGAVMGVFALAAADRRQRAPPTMVQQVRVAAWRRVR